VIVLDSRLRGLYKWFKSHLRCRCVVVMNQDAKEHNALLKDHLEVTKDLLESKKKHVDEVEYQWVRSLRQTATCRDISGVESSPPLAQLAQASSKARLAQAESEREEFEADVELLEDIVSKLKRFAIQSQGDLRVRVCGF